MINTLLIGPVVELGRSLVDRIFPDKTVQAAERAKAELELAALQQSGGYTAPPAADVGYLGRGTISRSVDQPG